MLKNYTIAKRLKIAFFWMSLLVALGGVVGVVVIQIISRQADVIFKEKYPVVRQANDFSDAADAELLALHSFLLKEKTAAGRMETNHNNAALHIKTLADMLTEATDRQNLSSLQSVHEKLSRLYSDMVKSTNDVERDQLMDSAETDILTLQKSIKAIIDHSEADMTLSMEQADLTQTRSLVALIAITLLAFFAAFQLGQRVSAGITRPLGVLVDYSKQVAGGDLNKEIALADTKDEIGTLVKAFRTMIENLRHQLQDIIDGTTVIASSVSELSASSAQLASSSAENATSINETTTTVEEVRQTTELASTKAQQMADESRHIKETSRRGREATDGTIESMNKIQTQMGAIAETIIRLSEQSQAIGQIIATVDSLSEQSNVLAVNASIEAAKAGEHGKGFSVVAQEVKSLAQQSKQATMQVRNILNEIQKATSTAVMATEQGGKVVEKGTETAGLAGKAIVTLTEGLDQSANAATQIASASQQQRVGMDQITSAMESVREASQQNAASAKQLEGAVHNLKMLGEKLKGIVASYRI
jgi:methyl-accepting chemotaxis protein